MEAIAFMGRTYKRFRRCGEVDMWRGHVLSHTPTVILMQIRIKPQAAFAPETGS